MKSPKFWILHSLSFDWRLAFHCGISWLPLRYFLTSRFVPSDNSLMSSNYSFAFFLITPLVSYDYVIGPIGHSVSIFRSLRWYLLITPLVSSDYPFGIFWLPLWYLLITPLVSSDYTFGIIWSLHWYLLITPLVSSDYPFGIIWSPLWYLLITSLVSSDKLFVIFWLTFCYFQAFCVVVIDICLANHKLELPSNGNLRNIIKFDGVHRFTQQIPRI